MLPDWSSRTKFIEIDVRDGDLARRLTQAGYQEYLGVSKDQKNVRRLKAEEARVVHTCERRWVLRNNADVLILSGRSPLYLWRLRDVRHADFVAWRLGFGPILLAALLGWLVRYCFGQYSRAHRVGYRDGNGRQRILLVARVRRRKRCHHEALHFIPHSLGLGGVFAQFHAQKIQYAVLRWFEGLPEREPEGDVDLLVADDDLRSVFSILNASPGIQPCDIYTPSGLAESRYLDASYYPPPFARLILEGARRHRGFCQVPNESDYFHSLAYHAVYHKGPLSGLPGSEKYRRRNGTPAHDFVSILSKMAKRLGISVEISLAGLHAHLQQIGVGPTPDFLVRMAAAAPKNRWLAKLASSAEGEVCVDPGLVVWVIRESAVEAGVDQQIIRLIEASGFESLCLKRLTPEESLSGSLRTRGGNWGPGPRDHLGGLPVTILATFDLHPLRPTRSQRKRFPRVTNARTLVKEEIRRKINAAIAPARPINGVHSSDYGAEAHHFLTVFAPELIESVNRQIADRRAQAAGVRRAA